MKKRNPEQMKRRKMKKKEEIEDELKRLEIENESLVGKTKFGNKMEILALEWVLGLHDAYCLNPPIIIPPKKKK